MEMLVACSCPVVYRVDGKQSDEEVAKAWELGPTPTSPPVLQGEQDSITLRGNLGRSERQLNIYSKIIMDTTSKYLVHSTVV